MTAFYKFTDTTGRYYPTLEINVAKNDVVDFAPLGGSPPDPDRWTTSTGPATVAPGSGYTYPGGAPTSPAPLLGPWVPNVAYMANQAVMSPAGTVLTRLSGGTSRATFDTTEAAQWVDSDLTSIAALTPSDGQALVWSTALGAWTIANPSGNALLAIGQNATGTTQTGFGASGLTDVTGCTVVAPANTARPVLAWAYCTVLCTATPTGTPPIIKIVEVSNGFDTPITAVRGAAAPISAANVAELVVIPMFQILPSVGAHDRTFKLQYQVPASNTASWVVENGANGDLSVIGLMVA